jgi:diguanylate cyclase (GGDEF)-like protein
MNASTLLPTRSDVFRYLSQSISQRHTGHHVTAVILVHLLRLREVNTSYGFAAGDELLALVTQRLQKVARPGDFIGQYSATEFALILPGLMNAAHAELAVKKILSICDEALMVQGQRLGVELVVGAAMHPDHAQEASRLVQCAELALGSAKRQGHPFKIFSPTLQADEHPCLVMENELRAAVSQGQLLMHYQPQIELHNNSICGFEALIRWQHPERGFLAPGAFIHCLERSSLIGSVTLLTLNAALRQCKSYLHGDVGVAVNFSARVLHDPHLVDLISKALNLWGIPPKSLVLEVTESAMMDEPQRCVDALRELRNIGVTIALDDFGTGYSSLSYLRTLPLDEVKIDRSFVQDVATNTSNQKIVRAVIDIARTFGLRVIAEGIEDERTLDMLRQLGCDRGQGYFFAKPMPPADLDVWCKKHESTATKALPG